MVNGRSSRFRVLSDEKGGDRDVVKREKEKNRCLSVPQVLSYGSGKTKYIVISRQSDMTIDHKIQFGTARPTVYSAPHQRPRD